LQAAQSEAVPIIALYYQVPSAKFEVLRQVEVENRNNARHWYKVNKSSDKSQCPAASIHPLPPFSFFCRREREKSDAETIKNRSEHLVGTAIFVVPFRHAEFMIRSE